MADITSILRQAASPDPDLIRVVIRPVGFALDSLPRRDRKAALSEAGRRALAEAVSDAGLEGFEAAQDDRGVPLPWQGWSWSISHKPRFVGGAVGPGPLGLDIDTVAFRRRALYARIATDGEWDLAGGRTPFSFARIWTAKESVIKALGTGLRDLFACRVTALSRSNVMVECRGRAIAVEQVFFRDHVAALAGSVNVTWDVMEGPTPGRHDS